MAAGKSERFQASPAAWSSLVNEPWEINVGRFNFMVLNEGKY
jgi:hypothetical protein